MKTESLLLVVEAKNGEQESIGMPQLLIYMAAIHEARKGKNNQVEFGMLSDAQLYWFACLDERKRLIISEPLDWKKDQVAILAHLDTVLRNAIESSPHTTPSNSSKHKNTTIRNYRSYLHGSWEFANEEDEIPWAEPGEEQAMVDVIKTGSGIVMLRTITQDET